MLCLLTDKRHNIDKMAARELREALSRKLAQQGMGLTSGRGLVGGRKLTKEGVDNELLDLESNMEMLERAFENHGFSYNEAMDFSRQVLEKKMMKPHKSVRTLIKSVLKNNVELSKEEAKELARNIFYDFHPEYKENSKEARPGEINPKSAEAFDEWRAFLQEYRERNPSVPYRRAQQEASDLWRSSHPKKVYAKKGYSKERSRELREERVKRNPQAYSRQVIIAEEPAPRPRRITVKKTRGEGLVGGKRRTMRY